MRHPVSIVDVIDAVRDRILAQPLRQAVGDETGWREQPTMDTESQSFLWAHATFAIIPGDVVYGDRARTGCRAKADFGVVLLMNARATDPDHQQDLRAALRGAEDIRGALTADVGDIALRVFSVGLTAYDPERGLFILGVAVEAIFEAGG